MAKNIKNKEEQEEFGIAESIVRISASTPIGNLRLVRLSTTAQKLIDRALKEGKSEIPFEGTFIISDVIPTETKIEKAKQYCRDRNIKPTVRNIAKYADVSIATVSRYNNKHK